MQRSSIVASHLFVFQSKCDGQPRGYTAVYKLGTVSTVEGRADGVIFNMWMSVWTKKSASFWKGWPMAFAEIFESHRGQSQDNSDLVASLRRLQRVQ